MGTNGEGGWELKDSVGEDAFEVEVDNNNDSSSDFTLSTLKQTLVESVAVSGDHYFKLKYWAPSSDTKGVGVSQDFTITITASSGLSKNEVEKMQQEAEVHAEEDSKRREENAQAEVADPKKEDDQP